MLLDVAGETDTDPALPVTCYGVGPFLKVNAVRRVHAHDKAGLSFSTPFLTIPSTDSMEPLTLRQPLCYLATR